jgi:hypothetical protein
MSAIANGIGQRAKLLKFRDYSKGTLLGFAQVAFASGMIIGEIGVHRQGNTYWAAPPARLRLRDGSSEPMRGDNGKLLWSNDLIGFESPEARRRWSDLVMEAIRRDRPGLLTKAQKQPAPSGQEARS